MHRVPLISKVNNIMLISDSIVREWERVHLQGTPFIGIQQQQYTRIK